MKNLYKFLAPVAMAAAAFAAPHASAGLVYTGPAEGNVFIGSYNPNTSDFGIFFHDFSANGAFEDRLVFNFAPNGSATTNVNFNPDNFISGFTAQLYSVASDNCSGALGSVCGSVSLGSLIATGTPGMSSSNIPFTPMMAGRYALVVTGTVNQNPVQWSGQLNTRAAPTQVPEPASLALVGIALLGAAGALAKRKKA